MGNNFNGPAKIVADNINVEVKRAARPIWQLIMMGIMAGAFIAMGAASSNVVMHGVADVGLSRMVGALIFPVGLILIVMIGGELFTGDCLLIFGILDKKVKVVDAIKVLIIVWIANLIGSVVIAFFVAQSGQWDLGSGMVGAFTIKVAMGKSNAVFSKAFFSGIMCNIFVCLAVLLAGAGKDAFGKMFGAFLPICAFVLCGFEHCVANMYYIPAGIFAAGNETYANLAMEKFGYTADQLASINWGNFFVKNMIPVTLGNIVGGMVCIGVMLYYINQKEIKSIQNNG